MINNRWLVKLFEEQLFGNNSIKINSSGWLEDIIDNAASWAGYWNGPGHWEDTHIYTWKQWRERAMEAYRRSEERRQKWLESEDSTDESE